MSEKRYSKEHEWVSVAGGIATVGISVFAQEQLGDVVFVELPEVGRVVSQNDAIGVVESVKAASEIYTPVSGEIIEINHVLENAPETVNQDAEDKGWMFKIRMSAPNEVPGLLDLAGYKKFTEENN
jgi:glycine cleavage system H protein